MKRIYGTTGVLLVALLLGSCAAKKELISLRQDYQSQQGQLQKLNETNQTLERKSKEIKQNVTYLNEENDRLANKLVSARESLNELSNQEPECPEAMVKGVVFKVQIGAFKKREISKNLDQSVNLGIEEKAGFDKVIIGQFRDYKKADRLKVHLRAMGIEDAWITPYLDGERVELSKVIDKTGL